MESSTEFLVMIDPCPPGMSGGKGDGVQLAVAFASVSFYYFSPGIFRCTILYASNGDFNDNDFDNTSSFNYFYPEIFRCDLTLCKPAIHSDKLCFSAS